MLTVFSTFKPFSGHTGIIQRNAIRSWANLSPKPELLFFDEVDGLTSIATEVAARVVPEVGKTNDGRPIISDLFAEASRHATGNVLCYVNGDIIFPPFLPKILTQIPFDSYLLVGNRFNLTITEELEFNENTRTDILLREAVPSQTGPDRIEADDTAIDYFILPKQVVHELSIPDFLVGVPCWDNWLLYRIRAMGIPLIDITPVFKAIHQEHEGGYMQKRSEQSVTSSQEHCTALQLAGGWDHLFFIRDATHILTQTGLQRAGNATFSRRLRTFGVLHPVLGFPVNLVRKLLGKTPSTTTC